MAVTLNASSTAGLITTADTSTVLQFQSNGTTTATIDASGNFGLGVTPSAWASTRKALQLPGGALIQGRTDTNQTLVGNNWYHDGSFKYTANGFATNYEQAVGGHFWYTAPSGTAGNAITFTQAMTLDASGNLGIGTTSPLAKLEVYNSSVTAAFVPNTASTWSVAQVRNNGTVTAGNAVGIAFVGRTDVQPAGIAAINSTTGGGATSLAFMYVTGNTTTEGARIDSSGNLLVGTTSYSGNGGVSIQPSATRPQVYCGGSSTSNSDSTYMIYSSGAAAYRFYVGYGGTISATNTTITGISDQRLKENIRDLDEGLATVMALKPRKFDWKAGKGADIKNARGFIAQEFEQVLPEMIETWRDPAPEGEEPYKAINANLIPTLVKAIQEQQAIIESLKARLDAANL